MSARFLGGNSSSTTFLESSLPLDWELKQLRPAVASPQRRRLKYHQNTGSPSCPSLKNKVEIGDILKKSGKSCMSHCFIDNFLLKSLLELSDYHFGTFVWLSLPSNICSNQKTFHLINCPQKNPHLDCLLLLGNLDLFPSFEETEVESIAIQNV